MNLLLLATIVVMVTCLSGCKGRARDNETGSSKGSKVRSSRETVCTKYKCGKYDTKICILDSEILMLIDERP
jgi:hypothetical protein